MKEKMVGDKLDLNFFNALVNCFKEKPLTNTIKACIYFSTMWLWRSG